MNGNGLYSDPTPSYSSINMDTPEVRDITIRTAKPGQAEPVVKPLCRCDCTRFARLLNIKQFWFVGDICGFICAIFTWMLILYAEVVVTTVILGGGHTSGIVKCINVLLFQTLAFLATVSHLKAMFSDPGTVPIGNATRENILKMGFREGQIVYKCPKCSCIKPERAHHCSICRRCVKKMDHHCPWVNNCVGEGNQKYFILFTFYIFLMSCDSLYLGVQYFTICLGSDWEGCSNSTFSPAASSLFIVFLLFEGIFFGLFTIIMCGDQLRAVLVDETGIESLKRNEPHLWKRRSRWNSLEDVFGYPFSWRWFSPFVTPLLHNQHADLYTV